MKIVEYGTKYNFRPELIPLFEAMKRGERIKKVTIMRGAKNKHDRSKDIDILDFKALEYARSMGGSTFDDQVDYVYTDKSNFYMSWVVSFELY